MGKTLCRAFCKALNEETPPRAWGRLRRMGNKACKIGNTPTCMGKTNASYRFFGQLKKHPHVHGEDVNHRLGGVVNLETPPRAWGRLKRLRKKYGSKRNTPTCMGKTIPL